MIVKKKILLGKGTGKAVPLQVAGSIPAGVSGFFIDIKSFLSYYVSGVDSASNINEFQEYFREGG